MNYFICILNKRKITILREKILDAANFYARTLDFHVLLKELKLFDHEFFFEHIAV